jgi:hypothetical protein
MATIYIRYDKSKDAWYRAETFEQVGPLERHGQFKYGLRDQMISHAIQMHRQSPRSAEGLLVAVEDYDGRVVRSIWRAGCAHEKTRYSPTGDDVCVACGHCS